MLFCNYFVNFIAYDLKNKYQIYIENIGYFRKYRDIFQPAQNIQNDCHQWLSDSFKVHKIRFLLGLRLRNDLYCVGWGVKLYSLTHAASIIEQTIELGLQFRFTRLGGCESVNKITQNQDRLDCFQ